MKKYALIVFTITVLIITTPAFFSCEDEDNDKKVYNSNSTQDPGNPYNILKYQPKTEYNINIVNAKTKLKSGKTDIYQYETGMPGGMIIVRRDESLTFNVTNSLNTKTSLHWHGLRVPYDQDGPSVVLNSGDTHTFNFTLDMTGTHWYHPHMRPILPQLNRGLYAPFIIKEDYDSQYAGDYVFTLDDWTINPLDNSIADDNNNYGGSHGYTELVGNVETVNRRYGNDIYPVTLKKGEIVKLRFINASTAQSHTLSMAGHEFRVTHLDGHYLLEPYTANRIRIAPGERVDAELKGIKSEGTYYIRNERGYGIRIPVKYKGVGKEMESPFVPGVSKSFGKTPGATPDHTYVLNSNMDHSGDSHENESIATSWTINGKAFVDHTSGDEVYDKCTVDQVYILRFKNEDVGGLMHHINRHPMHLHGGHFQVVSINGTAPEREMWKDTMEIPANTYVDVAVKFQYPGHWMLHCHIIDHEDNGMLTMIIAE
ncbi:MAG: multicopper oxidase family protein [Treponema sp.]|jgi:FtsP/CotA-like multicopper oxidase with cupredoxin domain|nr:multicopper oxidase family protein [Treponema sp.]